MPILSLPAELLMEIFCLCVPTAMDTAPDGCDMRWVNVTYVCRQWRCVALSCPELWSNVVFSKPRWTDVMIERSGTVPLAFRVDINDPTLRERMVPRLLANIHRLGTLAIRAYESVLEDFIQILRLASVGTVLESIIIECPFPPGNPNYMGVSLPEDMFKFPSNTKARLRYVELHGCAFGWDTPYYNNLTDLSLILPPLQCPPFMALVMMLSSSPQLETLSLGRSDLTGITKTLPFRISLPRLRYLRLEESVRGCAYIFATLSFPSTAALNISLYVDSGHRYLLPSHIYPTLFSRRHDTEHTLRFTTRPYFTEWSLTGDTHGSIFRLAVMLTPPSHYKTVQSIKDDVFLCFHRSHYRVRNLHLEMNTSPGAVTALAAFWASLYALPDVVHLFIHEKFPGLLFEYLLERTMHRVGVGHSVVYPSTPYGILPMTEDLLPNLQAIHLHDVALDTQGVLMSLTDKLVQNVRKANKAYKRIPVAVSEETARAYSIPTVTQMVRAFLWARRSSSLPSISQLSLVGCSDIFVDDLAHFRFFCDVAWDGQGLQDSGSGLDAFENPGEYAVDVYSRMIPSLRFRVENVMAASGDNFEQDP